MSKVTMSKATLSENSHKKLGRNPLEKKRSVATPAPFLDETTQALDRPFILEKIQELGLEIDWEEFLRAAVGDKIRLFSRFFLRF